MHTARTFGLLAGVVALIVATPSAAQDGDLTTTPESGDTFTVGVGVGYAPSYQGSDDYKVVPVPALRGRVSGFNFNTRGASLNVDFVREEQGATLDIQLGPSPGFVWSGPAVSRMSRSRRWESSMKRSNLAVSWASPRPA